MSDEQPKEGWGWPARSKKAHWFINGISICGKWMYTGPMTPEQGGAGGPDDCKECCKRLAKRAA